MFKYARPHLSQALRGGGRSLSQSKERHRARSMLVVVQVALALVLLVSSGLMIRTFQALRHVDPGFRDAHDVQTLRIYIPEAQVKEPERVIRMEQEILDQDGGAGRRVLGRDDELDSHGGTAGNDPIYAEDHTYARGHDSSDPALQVRFVRATFPTMGSRLVAGPRLDLDRDLQSDVRWPWYRRTWRGSCGTIRARRSANASARR